MSYTKEIEVRWSDLDANGHVTHTAYASFATHTRTSWMNEIGFPIPKLIELGLLAVLTKEVIDYHREVFLNEKIKVVVYYAGASSDSTRWKFRQEIYKENGKLAAVDTVYGAWINTGTRRIVVPPQDFLTALNQVEKAKEFETIF